MKNIVYFILLFSCCCINAQDTNSAFIKYFNKSVPIYNNPINDDIKTIVFQDSINETNYYNLILIDKSPLRFKVKLQAYDYSPMIEGWIDKDCVAVFLRSNNKEGIIFLYEKPSMQSEKYIVSNISKPITVIDYKDNWFKIAFIDNGKLYIGWTNSYCPSIYNSCT